MEIRDETEYLQIAGIQHFVFCRRQWALIHIEQQWMENYFTVDGKIKHEKADGGPLSEKIGSKRIMRSVPVVSHTLQMQGVCDVVELIESKDGEFFSKYNRYYKVSLVEYKRGKPKESESDILQLVAQSMCLEEMLGVTINSGSIFYFETRHRERIEITESLKDKVKMTIQEMNGYYRRAYTPIVRKTTKCKACSLKDICLPELKKIGSAKEYIERRVND